jgi:hypothetical protein
VAPLQQLQQQLRKQPHLYDIMRQCQLRLQAFNLSFNAERPASSGLAGQLKELQARQQRLTLNSQLPLFPWQDLPVPMAWTDAHSWQYSRGE